jgi:ribosome-associated toxin RatA of RatAB toxin-antitoxin module
VVWRRGLQPLPTIRELPQALADQRRATDVAGSAAGLGFGTLPLSTNEREETFQMADQTTSNIVIAADRAAVMEVIADFPSYPAWAQGVRRADVLETQPGGRAKQVHFELDATPIKDSYTLSYIWDDDSSVTWTLVEGKMMRGLDGSYELRDLGDGRTDATYRLAVEIAIPMIGMLKRKAEKVIIDSALKGLKKRVESIG